MENTKNAEGYDRRYVRAKFPSKRELGRRPRSLLWYFWGTGSGRNAGACIGERRGGGLVLLVFAPPADLSTTRMCLYSRCLKITRHPFQYQV